MSDLNIEKELDALTAVLQDATVNWMRLSRLAKRATEKGDLPTARILVLLAGTWAVIANGISDQFEALKDATAPPP